MQRIDGHYMLLDGASVTIPTWWAYDSSDPFAVSVCFANGDDGSTVLWTFARELIAVGMDSAEGEGIGDVRCWKVDRNTVAIRLRCGAEAEIRFSRDAVAAWIIETCREVPIGSEVGVTEADLAALLDSA